MANMARIAAVLHNVRSAHNVGSVFRTADGAGVSLVVLSGYTPRPIDRFGRPQKEIAKTALGAEMSVPWKGYATIKAAVAALRAEGWIVAAVELDLRAQKYTDVLPASEDTAFVFGNEVRGLSSEAKALCAQLIEIPMRGKKESLNVSVTAGIILFAAAGE